MLGPIRQCTLGMSRAYFGCVRVCMYRSYARRRSGLATGVESSINVRPLGMNRGSRREMWRRAIRCFT